MNTKNSSVTYPNASSSVAATIMRANRSRDTGPELRLRSALHRSGFRFFVNRKVHVDSLRPVNVDIVFPRLKIALFVDGCFWHKCPHHRSVPRANRDYWEAKLTRNVTRDKEIVQRLENAGWIVIRVWEHEQVQTALEAISAIIAPRRAIAPLGADSAASRTSS
jgi:DNA mismatch endonuclease (patch repair protein)